MSGETISTAIITIASVICAATFVTAVYPPILGASAPVVASTNILSDRIKTDINIIHETNNSDEVYIWVKNTGNNNIPSVLIDDSDLFFGEEGNFMRIAYNETISYSSSWNYTIEHGGNNIWERGETIKIMINTTVTPGAEYFVKFIVYNGIWDENYFTV